MSVSLITVLRQLASRRPVAVIIAFFLLSGIIRLPQLTRPLSKHFESNTAYMLVSSDIWQKEGLNINNAAPIHKYRGEANIPARFYNGPLPRLYNSGTYLSMGPGSYLIPHLMWSIVGKEPTVAGIRIVNLILQLLSVLLIFYLVKALCRRNDIAVLAAIIAMFSPVAMWFQGNAYCHEVAVIPAYLGLLLMLQRIWQRNSITFSRLAVFSGLLYIGVLIDWLALFLAAMVVLLQIVQGIRKGKWNIPLIISILVSTSLSLLTIIYLYSRVVGIDELVLFAKESFFHRSLIGAGAISERNNAANIFIYLVSGYGLFLFAGVAVFLPKNTRQFLFGSQPVFLLMILTPTLHYVVFYNFANEHDYASLKWLPVVSVCASYWLTNWNVKKSVKYGTLIGITVVNCLIYQWVNFPGPLTRRHEPYAWQRTVGEQIAEKSSPDQYIFTNQQEEFSPLNWYAKRETIVVADSLEARQVFEKLPGAKAIFIEIKDFSVTDVVIMEKSHR